MAISEKLIGLINSNGQLKKVIKEVQLARQQHWSESKIIGCG